jgi:hypothetical protein
MRRGACRAEQALNQHALQLEHGSLLLQHCL